MLSKWGFHAQARTHVRVRRGSDKVASVAERQLAERCTVFARRFHRRGDIRGRDRCFEEEVLVAEQRVRVVRDLSLYVGERVLEFHDALPHL